jgi:hypothetical protein
VRQSLITKWPYIAAHCYLSGSFAYYVTDELRRAEQTNAPADAYAYIPDPNRPGKVAGWHRVSELPERTPESGLTYRERLEAEAVHYR